ncbi:TonB-dependent receptor [Mucilaginibacter sp. KACC 22063]|uniref:TonB-dependent receptor n=1 Tax=Mucilaginibacter sp. KACC 22063 TaxID=3025666 RepID=UPI0023669B59|nr:TonB-dependent receptor [Mucilaginibacter sp. KACC 22063]WDF55703.1 TonB-dependent receptor [Mucilaginibacter sp. KACC 22063]
MKSLFAAAIALLLPFLAAAQLRVSGTVTDDRTNQPLPGATVSLQNLQTAPGAQTDANGSFSIDNVKPGSYVLKITYIGYQTWQKPMNVNSNTTIAVKMTSSSTNITEDINVIATRAGSKSPTTFTNLNHKEIQKNNLGQDLPYLLSQTPSAVVTSDAGAGVGYTGIRIRGSDGTRINVTVNGIPYNDSESQGSYFVDLPDFASSVDNIQIQRGVGTSTNGAGAFGASINIQTNTRRDTAYAELNNSAGSYGTVKNTVNLGTGLLGGHFSVDGRLSRISSDGYIDRASSNLKSYFLSGAYYGKSSIVRVNVFSGHEKTYQAWNGVPADSVAAGNRTYNELGYINSRGYYYNNQTDNYTQNHYQLLYDQKLGSKLSFNGALHYTKGYGYYEEYKNADSLKKYGITPVVVGGTTIAATDLVRRLWLNNDFYGFTYNFKYRPNNDLNVLLGGAYNQYKGAHYNNIEWTQESTSIPPDYEYSRDNAKKNDFNTYLRGEYQLGKVLLYGDLQYRHVYYSFLGYDRNLNNVQQAVDLNFFNPKAGITFDLTDNSNIYASWAVGHREPNRDDYTNSTPASRPKAETLHDFELGYRTTGHIFSGGINGFYMLYKNQLVLTGSLNDVGAAIRTNINDSYRAGVELDGRLRITPMLSWAANVAISTNKVKDFHQFLYNYDTESNVETVYKKSDIAFSPSFVGNSEISFRPVKGGEIAFISKYVSKQYLDNTSNVNPQGVPSAGNNEYAVNRYLKSYFVNNLRLSYNFQAWSLKNIGVSFLINNIFSAKYSANGATYPDIEGGQVVNYNYYYPQAPRNFLASLSLKF